MSPAINQIDSYTRRVEHRNKFDTIEAKIRDLWETDCVTYPEEAELIEAIIRITESRQILEVGMYSGFATLHMIRAIYGNGRVTSIDYNPVHGKEFFAQFADHFTFVEGKSPDVLATLTGPFDFCFIDSSHDPDETTKEVQALQRLIHKGSVLVFHDVPRIKTLDATEDCPIRKYINGLIASDDYKGMIFPSPRRLDLERVFGVGYSRDLSPHLAVLIRQ